MFTERRTHVMPFHEQFLDPSDRFHGRFSSMRQQQMQPIIGNIDIGFGFAHHHLIVGRFGDGTRGEKAGYRIPCPRCDFIHLVHIFPSRRKYDRGATSRMKGSKFATRRTNAIFQSFSREGFGFVFFLLIVVIIGSSRHGRRLGCFFFLRCRIIENKVPTFKIFPLSTQINHTGVMISRMRGFIGMERDKVSFAPATTLLCGTRHVFARIGLEGQNGFEG
mmetsp:Transcript_2269/g.4768  ORF Transcript_2269/g.4768 Transcript_2269/m.4768 type:complete len:220 (+) Transcript_2269:174-833(+)